MLSSVLHSKTAIQVNIQVMRAFTKLRHLVLDKDELRREIKIMCKETEGKFRIIFETLDHLLVEVVEPKKKIGSQPKKNCGLRELIFSVRSIWLRCT